MSLTATDLLDIRSIVRQELVPIEGELKALRNDIKEIYKMIAQLQTSTITDTKFNKFSIEKKLLTLNAELLKAARQVGVTLPR